MKYVNDMLTWRKNKSTDQPKALRLFLLGNPGTRKSYTVKATISSLIDLLGDDWVQHVKLSAPTGGAAHQMSFGAVTTHRLFAIRIGEVGQNFAENSTRLVKNFGKI